MPKKPKIVNIYGFALKHPPGLFGRTIQGVPHMQTLTRPEGTQADDLQIGRRAAVTMFFAGYAVAALAADAKPIHTPETGLLIDEVLIPNGAPKP
jgi:hypothetical protein